MHTIIKVNFLIAFYATSILGSGLLVSCQQNTEPLITENALVVTYKSVSSVDEIEPITDSLVKPIIYSNVISLQDLSIEEKKQKFVDLMLPAILVAQHNIKVEKSIVDSLIFKVNDGKPLNWEEQSFLEKSFEKYNAKNIENLSQKLVTHPVSIILAQAAVESGWGTSRFFEAGNNIFGIWSYNQNEPRVEALRTREGQSIFVRKYKNLSHSIEDYFQTLARVNAYKNFRRKRLVSDNPYELVGYLNHYSEMGEEYTQKLAAMIRVNDFTKYDHYQLDPASFEEVPVSQVAMATIF